MSTKSKCEFKEGDIVELNEEGLKNFALSPTFLVKRIGYPNKFHVIKVKNWGSEVYPEGTVSLAECCGRAIFQSATCTGHPAQYFSLLRS